jgi:hypothetical protein
MAPASTTNQRRYSQQAAQDILRRAQRVKVGDSKAAGGDAAAAESEGLTRGEILETAAELGISEAQAATALAQYDEETRVVRAEQELRQLGYRRFSGHLIAFLFVNGALFLGGVRVFTGAPIWLSALIGLWATVLLLSLRGTLFPDPDKLRLRARKRIVDEDLKQSSRQFAHSLSTGASRLLSLSAQKIDEGVEKLTGKDHR